MENITPINTLPKRLVLVDRVRRLSVLRQINPRQLSLRSGLAPTYVCNLDKASAPNPTYAALLGMAFALNVTLAQLIGEDPIGGLDDLDDVPSHAGGGAVHDNSGGKMS